MVDEGDECRLYRVGGDTVVPEFTSQANLVQPVGSWEAGDLHGHQLHGVEVQQVSVCGLQVDALAPELQCLDLILEDVVADPGLEDQCHSSKESQERRDTLTLANMDTAKGFKEAEVE